MTVTTMRLELPRCVAYACVWWCRGTQAAVHPLAVTLAFLHRHPHTLTAHPHPYPYPPTLTLALTPPHTHSQMLMVATDTAEAVLGCLREVGSARLHLKDAPPVVQDSDTGTSLRPLVAGLMGAVWGAGKPEVPALTHVESALKHLGREAMDTASSLLGCVAPLLPAGCGCGVVVCGVWWLAVPCGLAVGDL